MLLKKGAVSRATVMPILFINGPSILATSRIIGPKTSIIGTIRSTRGVTKSSNNSISTGISGASFSNILANNGMKGIRNTSTIAPIISPTTPNTCAANLEYCARTVIIPPAAKPLTTVPIPLSILV